MPGRAFYLSDLENALSRGRVASVYAFLGGETFLKERALTKLRKAMFPEGEDPFNYEKAYADESSTIRLLDQARTLPFLGGRRLVVLKHVEALEKGPPNELQALENYVKNPAACTVLVLEFGAEFDPKHKDNQNRKTLKLALSLPEHHLFQRLTDENLVRFLEKYAVEQQYRIDRASLELLADRLDGDLTAIAHELEKLHLAADTGPIRRADIERAASRHHSTNIFRLLDSLAARDVEGALHQLAFLLETGEAHLKMLLMIGRFYQQALGFINLSEEGVPEPEILGRLKISFYQVRPLKAAALNYTLEEIRSRLAMVGKWEEQFKSIRIDADTHMEMLLVRLCRRTAPVPRGR